MVQQSVRMGTKTWAGGEAKNKSQDTQLRMPSGWKLEKYLEKYSQTRRKAKVGRHLKDNPVSTPLSRDICHLDQVAQSPIHPGLEHLQGSGIHSFSEQTVPKPPYPMSKEFLPKEMYLKFSSLSSKLFPPCLTLSVQVKSCSPLFLLVLSRYWKVL